MPTIDLHTHILPRTWPDWTQRTGYPGWIALQHAHDGGGCTKMVQTLPGGGVKHFRDVGENLWNPAARLEQMSATGVDVQVLSTVPVMFSTWAKAQHTLDLHRLLNDHIAEVCRTHPTRFAGLAAIPMQDTEMACAEMDRCVRDLGLAGVQIGTNVNGKNLDDPGVRTVLKHAAKIGACIFIHPWDMLGAERMAAYWMPWLVGMPTETTIALMATLLGGVLDDAPGLRVCFAHAGGSFPGTFGRICHGFECRRDLFPAEAKHPREFMADRHADRPAKVWVDSLAHDAAALRHVVELFGARRVALGSDYPFPLGEERPGSLIAAMPEFSDEQRRWMLGDSALEFLARSGTYHRP